MDEKHLKTKKILKTLGPILLIIGVVLDVVGLVDFFIAFANFGTPNLFWTLFIGLPLTGFGVFITIVGNMHEIHKYGVDESKDIKKDLANYMLDGTRDQVVKTVDEIKNGSDEKICPHCGNKIPRDSTFCPDCGKKLEKICSSCGEANEGDAKFCKQCGKKFYQIDFLI